MRRRDFITLLSGAAATWPLAARAQQFAKLPTIGVLGASSPSGWSRWVAVFVQRLRQLGWIEDRTVAIQYRWAEGRSERYAEIAAEFVRLKVDVIVTVGGAVLAVKQATSTIPVVFAIAVDPLGSGLVTSLTRPGANVTGLSVQSTDVAGKRLEILRELLPGLHRMAVIGNVTYAGATLEMREVEAAAHMLGLDPVTLEIKRPEDIAPAFDSLKGGADALYVCPDPLTNANHLRINTLALGAQLPTMQPNRDLLEGGGLLSYGPDYADMWRRAAELVDKILRGTRPADIPVEQPTKFELVINLTAAKALRLTIPEKLLAIADEVIE